MKLTRILSNIQNMTNIDKRSPLSEDSGFCRFGEGEGSAGRGWFCGAGRVLEVAGAVEGRRKRGQ